MQNLKVGVFIFFNTLIRQINMPEFPPRLVPNSIELAVPWQANNLVDKQPAYYERIKLLTDLGIRRSLRLNFVRHPVDDVVIDNYPSTLNATNSPLRLEQMGFSSAYTWYRDTLVSGLRPVTISPFHQMRSRSRWIDEAEVEARSWTITSFTCDSDLKLRQNIDFIIVLRPNFNA